MGFFASLIAGLASGETVEALRRARLAAFVYFLAGLAAFCGCGFLIAAGFIWTAIRYGLLHAALGFGVGFLIMAGLIVLVFRLSGGVQSRRRKRKRKADMTAVGLTAAAAVLPALLRSKSGVSAILGPVAALAAYAIYRENKKPTRGNPDVDDLP